MNSFLIRKFEEFNDEPHLSATMALNTARLDHEIVFTDDVAVHADLCGIRFVFDVSQYTTKLKCWPAIPHFERWALEVRKRFTDHVFCVWHKFKLFDRKLGDRTWAIRRYERIRPAGVCAQ